MTVRLPTPYRPILLAFLGLLGPFLGACSTAPVARPAAPPSILLVPCPPPAMKPTTNGELVVAYMETRIALAKCDAEKAALREWALTIESKK